MVKKSVFSFSPFKYDSKHLTLDPNKTAEKCDSAFRACILDFKVSPFHLAVGLAPSGLPLQSFVDIRRQFFSEEQNYLSCPEFYLVSPDSPPSDVKSFLMAMGLDEQTVSSVPTNITGKSYVDGCLGAKFRAADLALVRRNWALLHGSWITQYYHQSSSTQRKLDELQYQLLNGSHSLVETLRTATQYPSKLVKTAKPKEAKGGRQAKCATEEYEREFFQKDSVLGHLVHELIQRFQDQLEDQRLSFASRGLFSPLVHLTNASGTGKTRSALELGSLTNVILFKFGGNNGLPESRVGKAIIDHFHRLAAAVPVGTKKTATNVVVHRLAAMHAMHVVFQRILYIVGKEFERGNLPDKCILIDDVLDQYYPEDPSFSNLFEGLEHGVNVSSSETKAYDSGLTSTFGHTLDVEYTSTLSQSWTEVSLQAIVEYNNDWLKKRASKLQGDKHGKSLKSMPPLIFVLDEAHSLMKDFVSDSSVDVLQNRSVAHIDIYRLFRGTLRCYQFYWDNSIVLTISTVATAAKFNPAYDDPSFRRHDQYVHEPIVLWGTFDCFFDEVFGKDSADNWMDFLFSRERIILVEACGRPLWGSHLIDWTLQNWDPIIRSWLDAKLVDTTPKYGICQSAIMDEAKPKPYEFLGFNDFSEAFKKLGDIVQMAKGEYKYQKKVDRYKAVALLSLSVALQKLPRGMTLDELVRVGPFALFGIDIFSDKESEMVKAMAVSEGVFNGCATLLLCRHLEAVGNWLLEWIKSSDSCLLSKGEIGELIDRVSILQAIKNASRKETFAALKLKCNSDSKSISEFLFEPVGLESFLNEYIGVEATKAFLKSHVGLKGSFVSFSHFIYMGGKNVLDSPYDVAAFALTRGAAVVPMVNTAGVDALIPLVLRDGRLSFVYIQVKCGQSFARLPYKSEVLSSSPEFRIKHGALDSTTDIAQIETPHCYIYRHYDGSENGLNFKIFDKISSRFTVDNVDTLVSYQPCCAVYGQLQGLSGKWTECLQYVCQDSQIPADFLESNASLRKVWNYPANFSISAKNTYVDKVKAVSSTIRSGSLYLGLEQQVTAPASKKRRTVRNGAK